MGSDERKKYVDTRRYGSSVLFDFSEWKEESRGIGVPEENMTDEEQRNLSTYYALKTIVEGREAPRRKPKIIRPRKRKGLESGLTGDENQGIFSVSGLEVALNKHAVGVTSATGMFTQMRQASPPRSFELEIREAWKKTRAYLKQHGAQGIECDIFYADSGSINTYDTNGFPVEAYVADIARFEIYAQRNNKAYKFILTAFRDMDDYRTITQLSKLDLDKAKSSVVKIDVYKYKKQGNSVRHYKTLVQRRV